MEIWTKFRKLKNLRNKNMQNRNFMQSYQHSYPQYGQLYHHLHGDKIGWNLPLYYSKNGKKKQVFRRNFTR